MKNDTGLTKDILDLIVSTIKNSAKVNEIILYGSRAKGNYKKGSDIDLTIKGEELNLGNLFSLQDLLDDLLLPYKIDLSIYNKIDNIELLEHIDRVGLTLYRNLK